VVLNVHQLSLPLLVSCVLNYIPGYHACITTSIFPCMCVFISFICCVFMNIVLLLEASRLLTVCSFLLMSGLVVIYSLAYTCLFICLSYIVKQVNAHNNCKVAAACLDRDV